MSKKKSSYLCTRLIRITKDDSLAQSVEHNTFNVGVLGSNPRRITKSNLHERLLFCFIFIFNSSEMEKYPIPMVPGPVSVPQEILNVAACNYGSADLEKNMWICMFRCKSLCRRLCVLKSGCDTERRGDVGIVECFEKYVNAR